MPSSIHESLGSFAVLCLKSTEEQDPYARRSKKSPGWMHITGSTRPESISKADSDLQDIKVTVQWLSARDSLINFEVYPEEPKAELLPGIRMLCARELPLSVSTAKSNAMAPSIRLQKRSPNQSFIFSDPQTCRRYHTVTFEAGFSEIHNDLMI